MVDSIQCWVFSYMAYFGYQMLYVVEEEGTPSLEIRSILY